jgi:hypothetical protein
VPDGHAAFGISRAFLAAEDGRTGSGSGQRVGGQPAWRDLGLSELLERGGAAAAGAETGGVGGSLVGVVEEDERARRGEEERDGDEERGPAPDGPSAGTGRGGVVVGPARGAVGVPVGVRAGMRAVGAGASLRS